jgi:periplasmic copper chaperone A
VRLLLSLAAAAGLCLLAGPAAAHVAVVSSSGEAGSSAVLRFSTDHGCAGAATTGLTVQLPDGVTAVVPRTTEAWEGVAREGVLELRATTPVVEGDRVAAEVEVRLPEQTGTLVFPTIQRCEGGAEQAWLEVGEDPATLELPAPTLVVAGEVGDRGNAPLTAAALGAGVVGALALGVLARRSRRS